MTFLLKWKVNMIYQQPDELGKVVSGRRGDRRQEDRRLRVEAVETERRRGENRRGGLGRRLGFLANRT